MSEAHTIENGMIRIDFSVDGATGKVPGTLWLSQSRIGPVPLIIGLHGGSQNRGSEAMLDLARIMVNRRGFAFATIDGPVHGDRRDDAGEKSVVSGDFRAHWRAGGDGIGNMVTDMSAALDWLSAREEINANLVGYVGLSMGTAYGIPFAAQDKRVRVAVFGLWSADYPESAPLLDHAANLTQPVMFRQKWDDELMSRDGTAKLFDAIGSADKKLVVLPGGHADPSAAELDEIEQFINHYISRLGRLDRMLHGAYTPSANEVSPRLSRFKDLVPAKARHKKDNDIPEELYNMVSADRTYVFMAPGGLGGPISGGAGVSAGDEGQVVRVGLAICPPGNGPNLHAHMNTYESFICTRGRWQLKWGPKGEHTTVLEEYDTFCCPPGILRSFTNIADEDSHIMVVIQGDRDAFNDVYNSMEAKERIMDAFGEEILPKVRAMGLKFIDEAAAEAGEMMAGE